MIVTPLHRYFFEGHLAYVSAQMYELGPPTLRGYFDEVSGAWLLSEGTHRIRAAHALGLVPRLVHIPWWRGRRSLERARFAAREYGLTFPRVDHVQTMPQQTRFTEPTLTELREVTTAELQIAALLMCGVSDSFNDYMRTKEQGEIKPCLHRVR